MNTCKSIWPFQPRDARYVSLTTFRKNNKPVSTPVWIAESDGIFFVFSESNAGKIKRLRNSTAIEISACDLRGNTTSKKFVGRGTLLDNENTKPAEMKKIYHAFDRKYRWQMRLLNFFAKLNGRYDKRTIIAIELDM